MRTSGCVGVEDAGRVAAEACEVEQRDAAAGQLDIDGQGVARGAGPLRCHGTLVTRERVEERGLPGIWPADERDARRLSELLQARRFRQQAGKLLVELRDAAAGVAGI